MATVRRHFLLPVVLLALAGANAGAADAPLAPRLARALVVPHVSPTRSAAIAVDLATGKTVFAQNESASLAPASNEKLAVAYAVLVALGPDYRIATDVVGQGQQVGSIWQGDLVLKGYGDPALSSADLARLAAQVRAAGIERVSGSVLGDESFFDSRRTAPGWKPSFYVYESPPLSALSVDRGRYRGRVSRVPALAAATELEQALRHAGVAVVGRPGLGRDEDSGTPLASVRSPTLLTLVRWMDHSSDNWTAEILLKELGALRAGSGTTAAGAQAVTDILGQAGVPLAGVHIADGSGLSLLDRMTAQSLVAILHVAWVNPIVRPALFDSLPVAGVDGTLAHRLRRSPARGNVRAKTGSTDDASALSGYVRDRYAFALVENGHPLAASWARRAQDRFVAVLAAQ